MDVPLTATPSATVFCVCVSRHVPSVLVLHHHHIQPKSMGGPTTPDNLVWVCPTTHYGTHELLTNIIKNNGVYTPVVGTHVSPYALSLAKEGYARWVAAGKPGSGGTD